MNEHSEKSTWNFSVGLHIWLVTTKFDDSGAEKKQSPLADDHGIQGSAGAFEHQKQFWMGI